MRGIHLRKPASIFDGNAQVLRGVFRCVLRVDLHASRAAVHVFFAARGPIAAAHHHQRDKSAAGKPQSLRKLLPGRHLRLLFGNARRSVGEQGKRMLSRQIRIDQQGIESVDPRLYPGNPDLAFDVSLRMPVQRGGQ